MTPAPTIFIAGLRRSGTTILFDILDEDPRLLCFYEPLCAGRPTRGGGSVMKAIDYNQKLRDFRRAFAERHNLNVNQDFFNIGAPRDARLEASRADLGTVLREYLREMINSPSPTVLKFVRMTFLVPDLHALAPDALFVHIKKNPLRFTLSHLLGKRRKNGLLRRLGRRACYGPPPTLETVSAQQVFNQGSGLDTWSQLEIVDHYLNSSADLAWLRSKPPYYRLLFLWKEFNDRIARDGQNYFGERYLALTNEELARQPDIVVRSIYDRTELPRSQQAIRWARQHVRGVKPLFAPNDARWRSASEELGIDTAYLDDARTASVGRRA